MLSRLLDNKISLGNRLQLIWRQQRTLHHLQALAGIVISPAHRSGQDSTVSECLGQHLRRLTVWCEATEDGVLAVVLNYFASFFSVVLFKLCQGLNDRHQRQAAGTAC